MKEESPAIDWEDILNRFSLHKGTIRSFCKENNISIHQLYYRRKNIKKKDHQVFHAINIKEKTSKNVSTTSTSYPANSIKIEIGKAKIYIQNNDKASLSSVLEAIMKTC
ncbi:IS66 family insertion sequence element accessory protein TnpA [Crassaminicella indica]|uniref:Transposase n=1 Tax=Crassaminicella indica TaxID=2855394 RepID=A0ABX8RGV4_9CLOT|nr:hypothetical protein [Crassaminicella indica]QXM06955.1 hypothetical protein KVH43_04345 [Crassaminicella indica]